MLLGTEVVLGLRDIVFDVEPAAPRKRGTPTSAQFLAHVYTGQMAGWMKTLLNWYGSRTRTRPHCTRRGPGSRKGHSPPLFGSCLLWPRSPISATAELLCVLCFMIPVVGFNCFGLFVLSVALVSCSSRVRPFPVGPPWLRCYLLIVIDFDGEVHF